jgi:hypothetical protein
MPQIIAFPVYGVFNGGLNTRDDPRALPIHKSPYLRNVELRRNRVDMTPGYTAHAGTDSDTNAVQGIFVARYAGSVWLLKADGGKIKKLKVVGSSPDSSWGSLKTGLNTSAKVEFAQANNIVYAVNGVDTCQKWDLTSTPGSTSNAAGVPLAKTIAYFNQRLVTSNGDRVDCSNIGAYETFSSYKYADQGEGGTIQRVIDDRRGNLVILKDTGRYAWDGIDTSTSNPKMLSSRGTVAPRSVVLLPDSSILFADHEGVWRGQGLGDTLLSDEITPTWRGLNHAKLADAAATYADEQYMISATNSGGSANNLTLVFDFQLDGRAGGWLAHDIPASCWASYEDSNGILQVIFGSPTANSKVYRRYQGLTASEFNFDGSAINAIHYRNEEDFHGILPSAAGRTKIMLKLMVSAEQKGDYPLTIGWRKDNNTDFNVVAWSLKGTGTSNWSDSASDTWSDTPASGDIWEGTQKVEGLIPTFKIRGRTLQTMVQMNAINQPFTYYGHTVHFIPLKGFT